MISAGWNGQFDIINVDTMTVLHKDRLTLSDAIMDVISTQNKNEYSFAINNSGLKFGWIKFNRKENSCNQKVIEFRENIEE